MVNKAVFVVIGIFGVLLAAAVITLSVLISRSKDKTCTTPACINAANTILKNIDTSVDPCENFFEFSCGQFVKNTRIADDATSADTFGELRNTLSFNLADLLEQPINQFDSVATSNAKRYYNSCLDEGIVEQIGEKSLLDVLLKEFGGWPMVDNSFNSANSLSIPDRLVRYRMTGARPIFDLYVGTNPKDPNYYVLRLQQPGWFFNRNYYSDQRVMKAYKDYILAVAQGLNPTGTNIENEVNEMLDLEIEFSKHLYTEDEKRNQTFRNVTINELQTNFPQIDWKKFIIDGVFADIKKFTVNENEPILVNEWNYFMRGLEVYVSALTNKRRALENLLAWSFVKDRSGFLPKKYKNARLEFDKVYTGAVSIPPRTRTCANGISDRMPEAVGRLYVTKYFNTDSKKAATEMIENIRAEFKVMLKEIDWMDEESKKAASEKADYIDPKIGYPDEILNNTYLDSVYKDYIFTTDKYLENNLIISKTDTKDSFSGLRDKIDRTEWLSGPAVVNAFYSSTFNQICFPAGILQSPFYNSQSPNYLNYGGIGSVIGHEITHGFDDRGRLYDKNGVFFPDGTAGLWTSNTIQNYKDKAQCIVNQYSSYEAKQVAMKLNGFQTQGENIADNGGVKESYRAYQKWAKKNGPEPLLPGLKYNQNQLFFINYAQVWCSKFRDASLRSRILTGVHSPGEFRTIGPTSNYAEFAKAFNCKPKQANNPENKCSVW